MNTTDPNISFNEIGVCEYCDNFEETILPSWNTDERGSLIMKQTANFIREAGKGQDFDCIIGLERWAR
jgi:hypothetical protein